LNNTAVVKYVGSTSFSHGLWIGVELTNIHDTGKNSGIIKGKTTNIQQV
jgi:dynactin complex subunit